MTLVFLVATLSKIVFCLAFVLGLVPIVLWLDRRQSAMVQDRLGPVMAAPGRRSLLWGLLHPLADGLKLAFKEDFVPPRADRLLHALGPMFAMAPAFLLFAVVPFGDVLCLEDLASTALELPGRCAEGHNPIALQVASLDVGILFVFAVTGMGVVGAAIAGWASDNKFSLLGGLRAASQMLSYEVAMGVSIVGALMVFGTVRLDEMVRWQAAHTWGIVVQPLAVILLYTAAVAEAKRAPFDLPEGESEIVAGYFTEYSSMKFGMFYLGEYAEVVAFSAILATVFLGGWDVPLLYPNGFAAFGHALPLPHAAVVAIQVLAFCAKTFALCAFIVQLRWTVPRFRYDQLMRLGWRVMLPLSLANVALTGAALLVLRRYGWAN